MPFFFMYCFQRCFICRPSDSTVSEEAGIETRTVATSVLAVRSSNHSARSHPQLLTALKKFKDLSVYFDQRLIRPYKLGQKKFRSGDLSGEID
jgi:hypothetical protein